MPIDVYTVVGALVRSEAARTSAASATPDTHVPATSAEPTSPAAGESAPVLTPRTRRRSHRPEFAGLRRRLAAVFG